MCVRDRDTDDGYGLRDLLPCVDRHHEYPENKRYKIQLKLVRRTYTSSSLSPTVRVFSRSLALALYPYTPATAELIGTQTKANRNPAKSSDEFSPSHKDASKVF